MSEPGFDPVNWTVSVSGETDVALRTYLASQGVKKGELSRFIADAVSWRLMELNHAAAHEHNRDVPGDVLEAEIEQALAEVRAERFKRPL